MENQQKRENKVLNITINNRSKNTNLNQKRLLSLLINTMLVG